MNAVLALLLFLLALAPAAGARTVLNGAWTPDEVGLLSAEGLPESGPRPWELRLLDQVGARAGLGFALRALDGAEIAPALREGRIQFALPARPGGDPRLLYSVPFGERRELLFLPAGFVGPDSPLAALGMAVRQGSRIAIVRSEMLTELRDRQLRALVGGDRLLPFPSDLQAIRAAQLGLADAAIVDANVGFAALANPPPGARDLAPRLRPIARRPVAIAFAPDTPPETLARANAAIEALRAEGERLAAKEAQVALLRHVLDSLPGFGWVETAGLVAFALSGILIARREGWSLVGALVLAVLPALGGGMVRDLIVGRRPLFVLESPGPLLTVGGVVLGAWAAYRLVDHARGRYLWMLDLANLFVWGRNRLRPATLLEVTDAVGLAAFTVTGVLVALRFGAEPLWLWGPLLAALTAAGGGILRDVVRSDAAIPALRGAFYGEVALLWGLALSLGLLWLGEHAEKASLTALVAGTLAGAFLTRMAAWNGGWRAPSMRQAADGRQAGPGTRA